MSILGNDLLLGSGDEGYNLTRSLRFRSSATAYLTRTPAGAGNRKTFTWSGWVKRGVIGGSLSQTLLGGGTSDNSRSLLFLRDDNVLVFLTTSGTYYGTITTAVFRDPSAWYHIVCSVDTTQATTANRVRFYINNVEQTATSAYGSGYVPQNQDTLINAAVAQSLGGHPPYDPHDYFDGYLTEINFIDGQALTPSSFGSTNTLTGVWQPARYTGTYGTNGFYLPFTDNSALTTSSNVGLGKDFSGNGNYWTTNNISITSGVTYDSMTDVPTLTSATAANFAVVNPLKTYLSTITNGNLQASVPSSGTAWGTMAVSTGKWYFEATITAVGSPSIGIIDMSRVVTDQVGYTASGSAAYLSDGRIRNNNATSGTYSSYTTNDVIGIAFDCDTPSVSFYKNNTLQATVTQTSGISYTFQCLTWNTGTSGFAINLGQQPFTYTPPTGFVALNTFNLPTSTIVKGNTVMDATIWTGDGSSPRSITNSAGFKPDLVWAKNRSTSGYWNVLFDSVRGAGNQLSSNQTDAELASASNVAGKVSAFNSNGFSLEVGNTSIRSVNGNTETYVGWQWQAGQGTTSTNTSGTITSTVSVNASAGFSVVTYTGNGSAGATIGHGLGVAPSLMFVKSRSATGYWLVYSSVNGNTKYMTLNTADAVLSSSGAWNNTSPTSSVFSVGNSGDVNTNGTTYVAYCWTPIAGFSAFGSYTGNGSTDGPFVYTGFRPRWILIKTSTDASGNWVIYDTARNTYNVMYDLLLPNSSAAESAYSNAYGIDILSNGFKIRNASYPNGSGSTNIYMAFAETPTKFALAR